MTATIHFFIGKGGVGKSTISALTAIRLAGRGRNTLLVSMDPAHNQRDIFECHFAEKPKCVMDLLAVKEIDTDYWIKTYLADMQVQLKHAYRYQSAFNLQKYFDILKFSPGLEEYALLLAFENVLGSAEDRQDIIFDMPPTALTLRFLSLPSITLIWLEELQKLRRRIQHKKEIVSQIKLGKKTLEQDKVQARLAKLIQRHRHLLQRLSTNQSRIHLVMNNDRLSFSEAVRIRARLKEIGIGIDQVVVNKISSEDVLEDLTTAFSDYPMRLFPLSPVRMVGLAALRNYLQEHTLNRGEFEVDGQIRLN